MIMQEISSFQTGPILMRQANHSGRPHAGCTALGVIQKSQIIAIIEMIEKASSTFQWSHNSV